jgi:hypothetical protein
MLFQLREVVFAAVDDARRNGPSVGENVQLLHAPLKVPVLNLAFVRPPHVL